MNRRKFVACLIAPCDHQSLKRTRGLCPVHYGQWYRENGPRCAVLGCTKVVTARGWCPMHYRRWKEEGAPGEAAPRRARYPAGTTEKACTQCGIVKPLEDFYVESRRSDGLGRLSTCKGCFNVTQRGHQIRRKYGITVEQYDEMLIAQDERCAICTADTELVIDHDHITGAVRALVCDPCNRAMGCVSDDPARLRAAADYLEVHAMLRESEVTPR